MKFSKTALLLALTAPAAAIFVEEDFENFLPGDIVTEIPGDRVDITR